MLNSTFFVMSGSLGMEYDCFVRPLLLHSPNRDRQTKKLTICTPMHKREPTNKERAKYFLLSPNGYVRALNPHHLAPLRFRDRHWSRFRKVFNGQLRKVEEVPLHLFITDKGGMILSF
eukprot:gene1866-1144_t